jgi:endonuclease/exonuclease/phosphatase (EEP) superfamily protein YafD
VVVVVIPAVALAALSLASFAGQWVWWLDVLANFRAQFAVALVIFGLFLLISRWKKVAIGVLVVAGVNLFFVAPLYVGSPGDSDPSAPAFRIVNFNLLSDNESYAEVIDFIRTTEPDLVFLHEASRPWEVALGASNLNYEVIRARSDDLIFGTLILARDEVEAVSYGYGITQPRAVSMTYHPDDWPVEVKILTTHPLAPTSEERAGLRDAQLDFAAGWAADQQGHYLVVGDFNATPWSWPFRKLVASGDLRNSQRGFGLQPTFSTMSNTILRVPIDHLLHSDGLRIRDRRLGPSLGSDHFPLIVDLEYLPEP